MTDLRSNLGRMLVFAKVAEHGSFSAAASELRLSRPAVSASVAALEQSLGVSLLHRSTRAVSLTRVGADFLLQCQQMRAVAREAWEQASAAAAAPDGVLRVAMPGGLIAERLIAPALAQVARDHGIRLDLVCSDTRQGLVEGGFDAAIRVGTPREAGLIMRRVGRTRDVVVAGPAVAAQFTGIDALATCTWIAHTALPISLTLTGPGRKTRRMVMEPSAWVDDSSALVGLLRCNHGVGRLPRAAIAEELAAGTLVELMPERHAGVIDVFVLYPSRKRLPVRVRLMTDALRTRLKTSIVDR